MVCVQKSPKSSNNSSSTSSNLRQKRSTIRKETGSSRMVEKVERQMLMDISAKEFSGLRAVVPAASSSDLETVLAAIDYIQHLQSQLKQTSSRHQH